MIEDEEEEDSVSLGGIIHVYVGWINSLLCEEQCSIDTLDELNDGRYFCILADLLTKSSLSVNMSTSIEEDIVVKRVEGLLEYLACIGADMDCSAIEVVKGDMNVIMDVIWTLIIHCCVCNFSIDSVTFCSSDDEKSLSLGRLWLLDWVSTIIPEEKIMPYPEQFLEDSSKVFSGNRLLARLIEKICGCINNENLNKAAQLTQALLLAESRLGIVRNLVSASEVVEGNAPDYAIVIYLSLLRHKCELYSLTENFQTSANKNLFSKEETITEEEGEHLEESRPSISKELNQSSEYKPGTINSTFLSNSVESNILETRNERERISNAIEELMNSFENIENKEIDSVLLTRTSHEADLEVESFLNPPQTSLTKSEELTSPFSVHPTKGLTTDSLTEVTEAPTKDFLLSPTLAPLHDNSMEQDAEETLHAEPSNSEDEREKSPPKVERVSSRPPICQSPGPSIHTHRQRSHSRNPSDQLSKAADSVSSFSSESINLPSSLDINPTPRETLQTPSYMFGIRASPSSDPLYQLLEAINTKGSRLRSALQDAQNGDDDERVEELDSTNVIITLKAQLEALSEENSQLEEAVRQSNVDREEETKRNITLNQELLSAHNRLESAQTEIDELNRQIHALQHNNELPKKVSSAHFPTVDIVIEEQISNDDVLQNEKDHRHNASVTSDVELKDIEIKRLNQELRHTRDLLSARNSFDQDLTATDNFTDTSKLQKLEETVQKLEVALNQSNKRNDHLNKRLDESLFSIRKGSYQPEDQKHDFERHARSLDSINSSHYLPDGNKSISLNPNTSGAIAFARNSVMYNESPQNNYNHLGNIENRLYASEPKLAHSKNSHLNAKMIDSPTKRINELIERPNFQQERSQQIHSNNRNYMDQGNSIEVDEDDIKISEHHQVMAYYNPMSAIEDDDLYRQNSSRSSLKNEEGVKLKQMSGERARISTVEDDPKHDEVNSTKYSAKQDNDMDIKMGTNGEVSTALRIPFDPQNNNGSRKSHGDVDHLFIQNSEVKEQTHELGNEPLQLKNSSSIGYSKEKYINEIQPQISSESNIPAIHISLHSGNDQQHMQISSEFSYANNHNYESKQHMSQGNTVDYNEETKHHNDVSRHSDIHANSFEYMPTINSHINTPNFATEHPDKRNTHNQIEINGNHNQHSNSQDIHSKGDSPRTFKHSAYDEEVNKISHLNHAYQINGLQNGAGYLDDGNPSPYTEVHPSKSPHLNHAYQVNGLQNGAGYLDDGNPSPYTEVHPSKSLHLNNEYRVNGLQSETAHSNDENFPMTSGIATKTIPSYRSYHNQIPHNQKTNMNCYASDMQDEYFQESQRNSDPRYDIGNLRFRQHLPNPLKSNSENKYNHSPQRLQNQFSNGQYFQPNNKYEVKHSIQNQIDRNREINEKAIDRLKSINERFQNKVETVQHNLFPPVEQHNTSRDSQVQTNICVSANYSPVSSSIGTQVGDSESEVQPITTYMKQPPMANINVSENPELEPSKNGLDYVALRQYTAKLTQEAMGNDADIFNRVHPVKSFSEIDQIARKSNNNVTPHTFAEHQTVSIPKEIVMPKSRPIENRVSFTEYKEPVESIGKYTALYKSYQKERNIQAQDNKKPSKADACAIIAEIEQRIREKVTNSLHPKAFDYSEDEVPHEYRTPPSSVDELLERYGPGKDIEFLHNSILDNLKSLKHDSSFRRTKISKPSKYKHHRHVPKSEPKVIIINHSNDSSPREAVDDVNDEIVQEFLTKLDKKYGKNLQQRTSTPCLEQPIANDALDISHISCASSIRPHSGVSPQKFVTELPQVLRETLPRPPAVWQTRTRRDIVAS